MQEYDVVVVGGGPAGLSGAVALSRSRRSVLVLDDQTPRNAPAAGVHNYLGREGTPPGELLAIGHSELAAYGGKVRRGRVRSIRRTPAGTFVVSIGGTEPVGARQVLVATGLTDELPEVPGLAERWGRDVLHCPYCHGYEVRDRVVGVLATGPMALHQVQLFRQLTDRVTLLLHDQPRPGAEDAERLAARDVSVVEGRVVGVEVTADRLTGVRLATGAVVPLDAVVVGPRFTARTGVLDGLDTHREELRVGEHLVGTFVPADPTGRTSVPGVWVAGNVADLQAQVVASAAAGLKAGAMINADLVEEDVRAAVARSRGLEEAS